MKKCNAVNILTAILFNLILILSSQLVLLITQNIPMSTLMGEAIICGLPLVLSIPFTYMLKIKGKRLWISQTILAIIIVTLLIYGIKPSRFTFIPFNGEAFVFGILYTILHCTGLLVGSLIAHLIWYLKYCLNRENTMKNKKIIYTIGCTVCGALIGYLANKLNSTFCIVLFSLAVVVLSLLILVQCKK